MGQKGPGHPYEIQAQLKNSLYLRFQKKLSLGKYTSSKFSSAPEIMRVVHTLSTSCLGLF